MPTVERFDVPDEITMTPEPDNTSIGSDILPVGGGFLPTLTIAMGIATCLWGALGIVLEGNQATGSVNAMFGAGACFIVSGLLMQTGNFALPAIAGVLGILLGVSSRTIL